MVQPDLEGEEESFFAQELRRLLLKQGLQYCDRAVIHASQCRSGQCSDAACPGMKRFVHHAWGCLRKVEGGCRLCGQMNVLSSLHAKQCQTEPCRVPFCSDAKRLDPRRVAQERDRWLQWQERLERHIFPSWRVRSANRSRLGFSMAYPRLPRMRSAAMPDVLSGAFARPTLRERYAAMYDGISGQESSGASAMLHARSAAVPEIPPAQQSSDAPVGPMLHARSAAMPDVPLAQQSSDAPVGPMLHERSAAMPEVPLAQESLGATVRLTLGVRSAAMPDIPPGQESPRATLMLTLRSRSGTMPLATNMPPLPNAVGQNALQELERGLENLCTTEK